MKLHGWVETYVESGKWVTWIKCGGGKRKYAQKMDPKWRQ